MSVLSMALEVKNPKLTRSEADAHSLDREQTLLGNAAS